MIALTPLALLGMNRSLMIRADARLKSSNVGVAGAEGESVGWQTCRTRTIWLNKPGAS